MIIYVDVIILQNFIVDLFLIHICCKTLKIKLGKFREFVGAIIGCTYLVSIFVQKLSFLTKTPFKLIFPILIFAVILKDKQWINIIKLWVLFLIYSMIICGVCVAFQYSNYSFIRYDMIIYNFSYKKLLLSIMILYLVCDRVYEYIRDRNIIGDLIIPLEFKLGENFIKVNGFLDTGNDLREPISNLPVIVVNGEKVKKIDFSALNHFNVSYVVLNGEGSLKAYKPEYIKIYKDGLWISIDGLIAPSFCTIGISGEYDALLSRNILNVRGNSYVKA